MDKIKDKNTDNSFFWLRDKLFSSPLERASLYLGIAKNLFIFSAFLYFSVFLMTISGMLVGYTAMLTYFLYPVFVFSCIVLIYNIISYAIVIYLEKYLFLRYIIFLFCSLAFLYVVGSYLWISTFLSSINIHFEISDPLMEYYNIFVGHLNSLLIILWIK